MLQKESCNRCDWTWVIRQEFRQRCPKCNSPYFNKERVLNIRQDRKANTSKLLPDDAKDRIGKMDI